MKTQSSKQARSMASYNRTALSAAIICAAAASAMAADPRPGPPEFELSVSPPFNKSDRVERYRAGEATLSSPPYRFITTAAVTKQYGWFGPRSEKQSDSHGWSVEVYATFSKKVAAAYASRKDGYQLKMTAGAELETPDWGSYMVARLRRKQFSWGNAVSFLSQFTQDAALYAPHNGHLKYEVWGVTADRRYTVIAHISISHPKLGRWEEPESFRDYRSLEALKRDPDYKLIERCEPEEFTPSLTAFDRMLDSLRIQ